MKLKTHKLLTWKILEGNNVDEDDANNEDENPNDSETDTDMVETLAQRLASNSPPRLNNHIHFSQTYSSSSAHSTKPIT